MSEKRYAEEFKIEDVNKSLICSFSIFLNLRIRYLSGVRALGAVFCVCDLDSNFLKNQKNAFWTCWTFVPSFALQQACAIRSDYKELFS